MPYCLQQQHDHSWIVLNRDYKPIGMNTTDMVKYEEVIPENCRIAKIPKSKIALLSATRLDGSLSSITLYTDGTNPSRGGKYLSAYLEKVGILMKLKLKE